MAGAFRDERGPCLPVLPNLTWLPTKKRLARWPDQRDAGRARRLKRGALLTSGSRKGTGGRSRIDPSRAPSERFDGQEGPWSFALAIACGSSPFPEEAKIFKLEDEGARLMVGVIFYPSKRAEMLVLGRDDPAICAGARANCPAGGGGGAPDFLSSSPRFIGEACREGFAFATRPTTGCLLCARVHNCGCVQSGNGQVHKVGSPPKNNGDAP